MFRDREEAAIHLADRLLAYRGNNPLILAIPRGGVPMGRTIAERLEGELDVVLVHKLGAPGNPEFAIGSVDESGHVELSRAVGDYGIDPGYIEQEKERQQSRVRQRRLTYGRPPANAAGRIAILVDDGIATGSTLLAAIGAVRAQQPSKLVVAIGVAPPEAARRVEQSVDELVCLATPSSFMAVGQFYEDFGQVTDEEVIAMLKGGADG